MDNRMLLTLLLLGGVYVGFFIFVMAAAWYCTKDDPPKKQGKYDERQIADQRRAYQYAFFTLLGYLLVFTVLDLLGIVWCTPAFGLSLGIALSLLVFSVFCIFCDAFFRVTENKAEHKGAIIFTFICLGVCQLGMAGSHGSIFENGCFTKHGIPLLLGTTLLSIALCIVIRQIQEKRAKEVKHGR